MRELTKLTTIMQHLFRKMLRSKMKLLIKIMPTIMLAMCRLSQSRVSITKMAMYNPSRRNRICVSSMAKKLYQKMQ